MKASIRLDFPLAPVGGRLIHGAEIAWSSQTAAYNSRVGKIPLEKAGFSARIVAWQKAHGRHDLPWQRTRDPYRIWVSEIMLQQTQVAAVVGYFRRFMDRCPNVQSLAAASEDEVMSLWSGLGYYARARNLHKAARRIVGDFGGQFPDTAEKIAELPGIGRSTAAAIAAFAFGERGAILDGNVKRVLARHRAVDGFPGSAKVESRLWDIAGEMLPGSRTSIEAYTQGLMDLGATICTRGKPACDRCPVAIDCIARVEDRVGELPVPRPKKSYPSRLTRWLVLRHAGRVLLEKRPPSGIWGGLLAFPELRGEDAVTECLARFGCVVSSHRDLPVFEHGFTHFKLVVRPLVCEVDKVALRAEESNAAWLEENSAVAAALPAPVRNLLLRLPAIESGSKRAA